MWYVFCCCSFSCPCSTKTSCAPCSSDWLCLFSLCSSISWSFPWTSTLLLFVSNFFLISSISMSVSHLSGSAQLYLLIFAQLQEKLLFHPIFSSFFVYIFFLWAHSLSNIQLQSCLLPFSISFSLLFDLLFDDNLLRPDQVPHACWTGHLHN